MGASMAPAYTQRKRSVARQVSAEGKWYSMRLP